VNKKITLSGLVQGVGFRPFVYQLATRYGLYGYIQNSSKGVYIEIEGVCENLENFMTSLYEELPPLARIDSSKSSDGEVVGYYTFEIMESEEETDKAVIVSPDISLCKKCLSEMHDPSNRRFEYPFINCTDCGPRYSITKTVPYDRPNTSMHFFTMCTQCEAEYTNPLNRRFHAQPISCFDCGPHLTFLDTNNNILSTNSEAIDMAIEAISNGKVIAIKGIGGFHLVCDARNEQSVQHLRITKNRPTKPLAVMFNSLDMIEEVSTLTNEDKKLIESKASPIVIVSKNSSTYLAPSIAPNISRIGVFLAYTPLHEIILSKLNFPIVATSANLRDEPIIIDANVVINKLSDVIYAVLTHDREIINACDDSVVMMSKSNKLSMRLARGLSPLRVALKESTLFKIMAVGANQKNTIAISIGNNIMLSPHIGDVSSIESFEYFERTVDTFKNFYDFIPEVIVCDKHPAYETTKWAKEYVVQNPTCELIEVQHHYAHALACMAEYTLDEKVLAFCFDGSGYGDDETLWGGEVLLVNPLEYERVHYFHPIHLIGAKKAIQEPNRVALSLLFDSYTLDEVLEMKNACVESFSPTQIKALHVMYSKKLNSPLTSSVGRLFDAVTSLSAIGQTLGYEGESGLLLECNAEQSNTKESFSYQIDDKVIDCKKMIKEILCEKDKNTIALKFISMICDIVIEISDKYPDLKLVFSGGVFQNRLLVSMLTDVLKKNNRVYYIQEKSPINDGGIALGQIYHAYHVKKKRKEK